MSIKYSHITPSNWRVGFVLWDQKNGDQYEIIDSDRELALLQKLESDEKNKPKETHGTVTISE